MMPSPCRSPSDEAPIIHGVSHGCTRWFCIQKIAAVSAPRIMSICEASLDSNHMKCNFFAQNDTRSAPDGRLRDRGVAL